MMHVADRHIGTLLSHTQWFTNLVDVQIKIQWHHIRTHMPCLIKSKANESGVHHIGPSVIMSHVAMNSSRTLCPALSIHLLQQLPAL